MWNYRTLFVASLALGLLSVSAQAARAAGPPTQAEVERQAAVMDAVQKAVAAEATPAGKRAVLTQLMEIEPNADLRTKGLAIAAKLPTAELDGFLAGVLVSDPDAGVRIKAAELLGKQGSEKCLPALARAAASDQETNILVGCILGRSTARRAATFAVADLVERHPKLATAAVEELRSLKVTADPDRESLADARAQSLYRVTGDAALIKPYYDRLKSKDAKVRRDGVVAFRFFGLKMAPGEIVAALQDEDQEVRSWAALVLGEIGDEKTVPALLAIAQDVKQDAGLRCSAIATLGQIESAVAKEPIRQLLKDENEAVRTQAAIAHYRLTGEKVKQFPEGYDAD